MEIPRKLAVRVGALGAVALAVMFVVLMAIGSDGSVFASTRTYHVAFSDVAGLREGAVVRLGGRNVGEVARIEFGPLGAVDRPLVVRFQIREAHAARVRADAVVRIGSQGLLGDKLLDVTLGSAAAPEVPEGGWLVGESPADPSRLILAATGAAEHARSILARLDQATSELDAGGALAEIEAAVAAVRRIAERVETGPGLAHALVYDERLAAEAGRALAAFERAGSEGARAMAGARRAVERVERVAAAVDPASVEQATRDLAAIAANVRAGRGTLGGLIMDPTLYEETKRILVNIRRNRVLKSVARLVISEDMPEELMDAGPGSVVVNPRRGPAQVEKQEVSGKEQRGR
jgi:phospholipid/cholesterol/gamma-HCH transport system substrate-binding protein